ncbi:beta strand repeat-containing protein [Pseudomonas sp. CGJS7]|uniref:beta strand repeat-containing protein n=1 Tax=Pseudomonas sp. CGJS7 TaxID=3109348 RepID=UPI00300A9F17
MLYSLAPAAGRRLAASPGGGRLRCAAFGCEAGGWRTEGGGSAPRGHERRGRGVSCFAHSARLVTDIAKNSCSGERPNERQPIAFVRGAAPDPPCRAQCVRAIAGCRRVQPMIIDRLFAAIGSEREGPLAGAPDATGLVKRRSAVAARQSALARFMAALSMACDALPGRPRGRIAPVSRSTGQAASAGLVARGDSRGTGLARQSDRSGRIALAASALRSIVPRANTAASRAMLALCVSLLAPSAMAQALSCANIYAIPTNSALASAPIYTVNRSTGALTSIGRSFAPIASNLSVNALGIDAVNQRAFATNTVPSGTAPLRFYVLVKNISTNGQANVVVPTQNTINAGTIPAGSIPMGAVNPINGRYYFVQLVTGDAAYLSWYDHGSGGFSNGPVARFVLPNGADNGDIAFDGNGNLYVVSLGTVTRLSTLPDNGTGAASPASTTTVPLIQIGSPPTGVNTNSAAFGDDGSLYISALDASFVSRLYRLNPTNGSLIGSSMAFTPATLVGDMAGCGTPPSLSVRKNFSLGRAAATDQIDVSITGGGIIDGNGNHGITSGNESGVQNQVHTEVGGPLLGISGTTYTISEAVATGSGTNLGRYATSWTCVNTVNSATLASGTGTSGTVTLPGGTANVNAVCTFTNETLPTLTIRKNVTNDNGGTGTAASFGIATTAGALTFGANTGTAQNAVYTATALNVNPGTYTLRENDIVGYTEGTWTCSNAGTGTFTLNNNTIAAGSVTIAAGNNLTCQITNNDQGASLTIRKNVTNDNGGTGTAASFGLATTAGTLTFGANTGTAQNAVYTATALNVNPGSYTLRENDIAGYAEGTWTCSNAGTGTFTLTNSTIAAGSITLTAGNNVTCQITNNDQGASLTIRKNVTNDNGGTGTAASFGLATTAGTLTFGANTGTAQNAVYTATVLNVNPGAYTLRENDIAGYTEGTWSCSNAGSGTFTLSDDTIAAGSITLAAGNDVTCQITNDDQGASLTIRKNVTNDNGGTGTAASFGLATTAGTLTFGANTGTTQNAVYTSTALNVSPGTYTLRENDIVGYTEGTWTCSNAGSGTFTLSNDTISAGSITLAAGNNVTCEITNDDQGTSLTIRKNVTNDNGGTGTAASFGLVTSAGTLTFGANTGTAQNAVYTSTALNVNPGTYTLRENDIAAYTEGTWTCSNAGTGTFTLNDNTIAAGSVTIAAGNNLTCEITNDDQGASLTIRKNVTNDNGGTGTAASFGLVTSAGTLTFGANSGTAQNAVYTATALNVNPDTYTLRENDIAGYAEGTWSCSNAGSGTFTLNNDTIAAGSITLAAGNDVTCQITNDDQGALLTIRKNVTNDNGGTGTAASFGLATSAGTLTFGANTGTAQNAVYTATALNVNPGTYTLRENDIAGYTEGTWSCSNAGSGTFTLSDDTIAAGSITLTAGNDVTCQITNNDQSASVTVTKVSNGGTGTFGFSGSNGVSAHSITTTAAGTGEAGTQQTLTASGVQTTITEDAPPAGFALTSIACTGLGTGIATPDLATRTVTLDAAATAAGNNIACTFTNTKSRTLTVNKALSPTSDVGTFIMTANGTPGTAAGDGATASATVNVGATATFSEAVGSAATDLTHYTTAWSCDTTPATTGTGTSGSLTMPDADVICTITNTRKPVEVTLKKAWTNGKTNDGVDLSITGGSGAVAGSSVVGGASSDATATASVGATVTLTEAFKAGSTGNNYTTTLACLDANNATVPVTGTGLSRTITMPATAVTCTYTNSRIAQQFNLAKTWGAGATNNHTASATTTGGSDNATFSSTAPTDTTNALAVTVYAGDELTLPVETFGGGATAANYNAAIACTGGTPLASATLPQTLTVAASTTATTCTYTNTPATKSLTLRKQWRGAAANDDASLTVASGGATIDTFESNADSADELDTDATPTEVSIGTTVTLAETLASANAGRYDQTLACTGAADTDPSDGLTIGAADSAIVCTFTNTRQSTNLSIAKTNTPTAGPHDQIGDSVTRGVDTTYHLRVTNHGSSAVTGAVVRDTPVSGLDCAVANPVTCTGGAGCPSGAVTVGELNSGVALGTLTAGESVTLSFSCQVQ